MRIKLGIPLTTNVLLRHCDAFSKNSPEKTITHITTDSREASSLDLFFSLTTDKLRAEEHIKEAKSKGAICVSSLANVADFLVPDCEKALLKLARFYKTQLKSLKSTIAITGSVGKTTTKEFCAALLSASYKTHKTYMNYNNALGLSLSILTAPEDTEILILELGMNGLGEIRELSETIHPNLAVITNIGSAHIGKLGSRSLIAQAKLEISSGMSCDNVLVPYGEPLLTSGKIKFSVTQDRADYYLDSASEKEKSTLYYKGEKLIAFSSRYKAYHHLSALTIALIFAHLLGISENGMQKGIKNCENITLRQRLVNFKYFSVYDDTYSSSFEAIKADIEYLKLEYPNCTISCALGDILELGLKTADIHKDVGRYVFKEGARKLYSFGSYSYLMREGAEEAGMKRENILITTDSDAHRLVAEQIYKTSLEGEIVLIKASHALRAGKIIEEIERLDKEC